MGKSGAVSVKQTQAITALLDSRSVAEAAEKCGTPTRTIYRWLLEDDFKTALAAAENELLDTAVRRLLNLQQTALTALQVVMVAHDTPPSARVAAARVVLDGMLKLREQHTIEQRLQAIEAAMEVGA